MMNILNINQFKPDESLSEFYCNTFKDHVKKHHSAIEKPHKHDFYLTVFFTKGEGVHEVDFTNYSIKKGSTFFLYPGQTHFWRTSADTDGYVIIHTKEFFELNYTDHKLVKFPFFYSNLNPPHLWLAPEKQEKILPYMNDLLVESKEMAYESRSKISSLLNILYIAFSREYIGAGNQEKSNSTIYSRQMRALELLIDKHFTSVKLPHEYAEMMSITSKHLNRITQNTLGKSTTQLITERVLLEAKRMLIYSNESFANIADVLGYKDYAYFSRLFKQRTGKSPSAFVNGYKYNL